MVKIDNSIARNHEKVKQVREIQQDLLKYFPEHQFCLAIYRAGRDIFYTSNQIWEIERLTLDKKDNDISKVAFGLATPTPKDTRTFLQKIFEPAPTADVIGLVTIWFDKAEFSPKKILIETYGQHNLPTWQSAAEDIESVQPGVEIYVTTKTEKPKSVG